MSTKRNVDKIAPQKSYIDTKKRRMLFDNKVDINTQSSSKDQRTPSGLRVIKLNPTQVKKFVDDVFNQAEKVQGPMTSY